MSAKCFISVLFLFTMFPFFAPAQKDYIVTGKGDTMYGKIKQPLFSKLIFVSKGVEYWLDETVKAYFINKSSATYYNIVQPETGDKVFMYVVEKGEISLYTYTVSVRTYDGKSLSTTNWYIEKKGTPISMIKSTSAFAGGKKDRKELLRASIADKAEILKLYDENDSFTFNNIRKIITEYNKLPAQTPSSQ